MVVTIAERIHLFPSRTQKLSSLTPKVLGFTPGRIGSCHLPTEKNAFMGVLFLLQRELNFWGKPQPKNEGRIMCSFAALHLPLSSLTPKVLLRLRLVPPKESDSKKAGWVYPPGG